MTAGTLEERLARARADADAFLAAQDRSLAEVLKGNMAPAASAPADRILLDRLVKRHGGLDQLNPESREKLEHWLGVIATHDELMTHPETADPFALATDAVLYPTACDTLSMMLADLRLYDWLAEVVERKLDADPLSPDLWVEKTRCLLASGDLEGGVRAWHRWRRIKRSNLGFEAKQPYWDGGRLDGKTILLRRDLGYGDSILFVRYAKVIADQLGGRVVYEVDPPMVRLAERVAGVAAVAVTSRLRLAPDSRVAFDTWCYQTGLPDLLWPTIGGIPNRVPYLRVDPATVERWRLWLDDGGQSLKVGLNWAGDPLNPNREARDIPLTALAPLRTPGVTFYALTKSLTPRQDGTFAQDDPAPPGLSLTRLGPHFNDFTDAAAALLALDLIITTDTSVANLAGALGRPTWLLLDDSPDFRWPREGERTVWYPTMRLFYQLDEGDWSSIVHQVADQLWQLSARRWRRR